MQINKLTWKDKVWAIAILLAALFVLFRFSVDAIKNANITLVDTQSNYIVPVQDLK